MPTLTGWEFPDSHDLNFSNRPVRTRMPGGVAGAQSVMAAPYADCEHSSAAPIVNSATRRGGIGVFERARMAVESPSASSCIFLAAWRLVMLEPDRHAGFQGPVDRASCLP